MFAEKPHTKYQQRVIACLLATDWEPAGQAPGYFRGLDIETGLRHFHPPRPRYRKPGTRKFAAVGRADVCFYEITPDGARRLRRFLTKKMARFAGKTRVS